MNAASYNIIFFTNVLRLLDERNLTRRDLAAKSNISAAHLTELTSGRANPSLRVMADIAQALEISLPMLLESTDLDEETLEALADGKTYRSLPPGYKRVVAVLPEHQAFIVKKWNNAARKKIREEKNKTD